MYVFCIMIDDGGTVCSKRDYWFCCKIWFRWLVVEQQIQLVPCSDVTAPSHWAHLPFIFLPHFVSRQPPSKDKKKCRTQPHSRHTPRAFPCIPTRPPSGFSPSWTANAPTCVWAWTWPRRRRFWRLLEGSERASVWSRCVLCITGGPKIRNSGWEPGSWLFCWGLKSLDALRYYWRLYSRVCWWACQAFKATWFRDFRRSQVCRYRWDPFQFRRIWYMEANIAAHK